MNTGFEIFLDSIVFQIQKFGGASTYWKELLSNFVKLNGVNIILQSARKEDLNHDGRIICDLVESFNVNLLIEDTIPVSLLRYLPLTRRLPPKSLYHNSYYRTCLQKNVVNIFTVHDFTHKRGLASKFPRKLIHIGLTALGLKNADGIICISQSTKNDLLHYYPHIREDKIRVIYHGVSDVFSPLRNYTGAKIFNDQLNLAEQYVLFVGKRAGYKKFEIIPEALLKHKHLKLVIVGGGDIKQQEWASLNAALPGRFIHLNGVNNEQLNVLYNYAHCLVYTSVYEGFGIPVLEAMKAGCPVITNRLSSLGEISGDAALFINDVTAASLDQKLTEINTPEMRQQLIAKGLERSRLFTWEKCSAETLNFYKEIYNTRFN
ncbi:hypothetical protein A0256_16660 [Mucilaginibacter sp. PAMC 26640]|nr:hypothetical protein A0256_16660 [Mucilaginibacter sp. PAMC 26640]